jgi:hypothetical protein
LRINGFFKGDAPYLLLGVKSETPTIHRQIHFLIDTGADVTGISTRDQLAMGRILGMGGITVKSVSGLADTTRTWEINSSKPTMSAFLFTEVTSRIIYLISHVSCILVINGKKN